MDVKKENEAKKEYLMRYRDAVRSEKQIDEEIKQLRLDTMMPAVVNDGMPHGSGDRGVCPDMRPRWMNCCRT